MSKAKTPQKPQRKPQARSVVTRESILDAALECLVERGYARTATADVAERAGVSRGAQLHHFPTRDGLLAATVEHLAERRLAELRRTLDGPTLAGDEVDAAIDFIWTAYSDATAYAGLELVIAARTDDDLLQHLRPVAARLDESLRLAGQDLALRPGDRARRTSFRDLAIATLQGLAVMRIVKDDDAYIKGVLGLLKELGRQILVDGQTRRSGDRVSL